MAIVVADGLSALATDKLMYLITEALRRRLSGVDLTEDESGNLALPG